MSEEASSIWWPHCLRPWRSTVPQLPPPASSNFMKSGWSGRDRGPGSDAMFGNGFLGEDIARTHG